MPTLHLGVIDVPYEEGGETTGEVAERLEEKYMVIGAFYLLHENQIADALADSVAGALENFMMGAPLSNSPFGTAEGAIKKMFTKFLEEEQLAGIVGGVPTQAALDGVNSRLKLMFGPRRPSFIDTGLYEQSFLAWMDGDQNV